jgi:putative ABC transport system permease protein
MNELTSPKKSGVQSNLLLRWSWREIYSEQLWPVVAALVLIVACVVALSALALRVEKVMTAEGRSMLAADAVQTSSNPINPLIINKANELALLQSEQVSFQTMSFSASQMHLINVKAVDSLYPLRGELRLKTNDNSINQHVLPGELWVAKRMLGLLDVSVGQTIAIGDVELTITGIIDADPELVFNPFNSIPAVFIHQSDIEKTGALQLGSRVRYKHFFNGTNNQLTDLQNSVELQPGERWSSEQNQGRSGGFIVKAKQYLSLTILMVIVMASLTLVMTCSHYASGRAQTIAMLKSLGASRVWLKRWLILQVGILITIALTVGSLLGIVIEALLRLPLTDVLPKVLPSYGFSPFLIGSAVAILVAVPALGIPLKKLLDTPAINVLQQTESTTKPAWWLVLFPVSAFIYYYFDAPMVWLVLLGLICLFVILALISYGFIILVGRFKWGASMSLAVSRLKRSPKQSLMQLAALSGSLMLIAVIWLLRSDLVGDWQQAVPENAPNVFAVNISETELPGYLTQFDQRNIERSDAFPVIRGRLSLINGQDVYHAEQYKDNPANILKREVNFTWLKKLPDYNPVLEGQWSESQGVSVEQKVARQLGLNIGDELTFTINSLQVNAIVNSIRDVYWQSMKPNFVFIFTPDVLKGLPATWMVSAKIEDKDTDLLNKLSRDFPTISLLDFRVLSRKLQSMLAQVSLSLTVLASIAVLSGLLLMFTLLRLSLKQRQSEVMLYRTLGATKQRISQTLWSEYGLLAVVAGIVATVGAELLVYSLMQWGFKLTPSLHFEMWPVLPIIALLIVLGSLRSLFKQLLTPL